VPRVSHARVLGVCRRISSCLAVCYLVLFLWALWVGLYGHKLDVKEENFLVVDENSRYAVQTGEWSEG
jgi:hypothetical protein